MIESLKQENFDLDKILARGEDELVEFAQKINGTVMFKNSISNTELIAKSHTLLKELYENPTIDKRSNADYLTVPETHSHTRLYCPKCMGAHTYENCFKVDGRRSRSRNFKED